jgi:autotransporter-associated beta strand protein
VVRVNHDLTNGTILIDNFGTMSTQAGQGIDLNNIVSASTHSTINNFGLISAAADDGIRPGTNASINNHGQIVGMQGGDGVDGQQGTGIAIHNFAGGSITGARHGVTGDFPITVTNDAGATILGQLGSGLNMDTAADSTMTVVNRGTITGTATGTNDGDGIDVDGLIALDNYALIRAAGHSVGVINEALALGGGVVNNHIGGVIHSDERAITVDNSDLDNAFGPTTIVNEGTIQGDDGEAVSITDIFADTITNKGSFIGSIAMGDGDDVFNDYSGSSVAGITDGGAGTGDTVDLFGPGTGTLAAMVNFELLNVESGSWTIADSEGFSAGTRIFNAATLQVGDGGAAGALAGDVLENGALLFDLASNYSFAGAISGTGAVRQLGGGVTTLSGHNSYSGGTDIAAGTLDVMTTDGAGTGAITFDAGSQTLRIEQTALSGGHFANVIAGFANVDTIDLRGVGLATTATLGLNNVLTIAGAPSGPIKLQLDPGQSFAGEVFQVTSDAAGGTNVTVAQVINGGNGNNVLVGTPGNDVIVGGNGNDTISSGEGNDNLTGGNGNDVLQSGNGNSVLDGGNGDDILSAGNGNNVLTGGNGNDILTVGNGNNNLSGGNGDDIFRVGTGNNSLVGGNGNDTFAFGPGFGQDVIADFSHGDRVEFDGVFPNFGAVQAAFHQFGADTVISLSQNHSVTLQGVAANSLHASDFILH